jgi:hypothetical protein
MRRMRKKIGWGGGLPALFKQPYPKRQQKYI